MATVFFLTKLKEGADQKEYEKWVKEYDYPTCKKHFKSVKFYRAYKVKEESKKDSPYDFIEHIDMTSIDDYKRDLEMPEFKELLRQWSEFIDSTAALVVYTDPIE